MLRRVSFLTQLPCLAALLLAVAGPLVHAATKQQILSLESAYDRTLSSDQSVKIAWWEIRKANLLPLSALTRIAPTISTGMTYTPSGQTGSRASAVAGTGGLLSSSSGRVTTRTDVLRGSISYQQTLLDFTVFPAYRLGKLTEESTKLQYSNIVRQVLFGLALAYYDVLKQQSIVSVNGQTVELASGQLDQAQKRFDVGQTARTDVLRSKATLEDARRALIQSQAALTLARNTLSNILNMGGRDEFTLVEPPGATFDAETFESVLEQSYARREDYKIARLAIQQDIERHNEVRGEYGPRVVASFNQNWDHVTGQTTGNRSNWDLSLGLQMPIFTGGQREVDLATTKYQVEQTRLEFEKTGKSIQQEVKAAWLNVRTLRETIKAVRAGLEAAEQNYKDLQTQYQVGTATSLDVDTALRDLNNQRTVLATQTYDYQVALRDLQRAQASFQTVRVTKAAESFSSVGAKTTQSGIRK